MLENRTCSVFVFHLVRDHVEGPDVEREINQYSIRMWN